MVQAKEADKTKRQFLEKDQNVGTKKEAREEKKVVKKEEQVLEKHEELLDQEEKAIAAGKWAEAAEELHQASKLAREEQQQSETYHAAGSEGQQESWKKLIVRRAKVMQHQDKLYKKLTTIIEGA